MTKKLNEAEVLSELREGSAFFRDVRHTAPQKDEGNTPPRKSSKKLKSSPSSSKKQSEIKQKRSFERSNERTTERTNVGSQEREKTRHTFDIFIDQLRALQLLQLEAVQAGKRKPKLGDMVQQALDAYLKKKSKSQKTFERTNEPPNEQI